MYVTLMATMIGRTNARGFHADLRDYARWEYGRNAEAWLLSQVRTQPRRRRPGILERLRGVLAAIRSGSRRREPPTEDVNARGAGSGLPLR